MVESPAELTAIDPDRLPRLLVISDITVERSGAGQLLLYRMLADYPRDKLRVVYSPKYARPNLEFRLPDIIYRPLPYAIPRIYRNRLNPFWPLVTSFQVEGMAGRARSRAGLGFHPQAIISVAHAYLWFAAAGVARMTRAPLHLFLHEEWPNLVTANKPGRIQDMVRSVARARIAPILRMAASRFSVSPGMVDEMSRNYDLSSELLYPNRGQDSAVPKVRVRVRSSSPFVVAHCGFIHLKGNAALLRQVAEMVGRMGGHLDLYTLHTDGDLAWHGLVPPIVRRIGFFPAAEMAERLGNTADALILTASFEPQDRVDMATLFPSKLADYTAIGLPLVVWGPNYSSAARWAAENPGSSLLYTEPAAEPIERALHELRSNRERAAELAAGAVAAGMRYFDLSIARGQLYRALMRSMSAAETRRAVPLSFHDPLGADKTQPRVSVVCLSYNRPELLDDALKALMAQRYPNLDITVVDNRSLRSGEVAEVVRRFPSVRLIANPENSGFASGMNLGIRETTGEFICLTEDDLVLDPNFVTELVEHFSRQPETGIAGGLLINRESRTIYCAGADYQLGPIFHFRFRSEGEPDNGQLKDPVEVPFVSGSMVFARRDFLAGELKGFRDDFFLYLEDLEFCHRARRAGRTISIVPRARAYHMEIRSAPSAFVNYHKLKNLYAVYFLHASAKVLPAFILRYGPWALFKSLVKGRFRDVAVQAKAWGYALLHLPMWLRDRRTNGAANASRQRD